MAEPEVMSPDSTLKNEGAAIQKHEVASDVLAAMAKAQVQARYQVALARPRDLELVRQKILKDCERPRFAEAALYKKPMGTSSVTGLSIRFAESAQRHLGNLMPERPVIYDDATKRIVRICMTDLESNLTHYKDLILEKTVERKNKTGRTVVSQRLNSYGEVVYIVEATEDELLTKESAISSKIERQLTLKILPGDIQEEALEAIRATLRKADKADPTTAKKRILDAFFDLGVTPEQVRAYLGVDTLDILSRPLKDGEENAHLADLRLIYAAIKDGETNWREVMEARDAARGTKSPSSAEPSTAAGKAKGAAKKAAAGKKTEPSAADPTPSSTDGAQVPAETSQTTPQATSASTESSTPSPDTGKTTQAEQGSLGDNW